jgi:hypothetical protein
MANEFLTGPFFVIAHVSFSLQQERARGSEGW